MNQGKYLKLNLPDYTDAADIEKLVENFEILEGRAPAWTDFSNSGTVLESTGNFTIATAFPVGEENTIFAVTAKMPRAFAEDDTITVDDVVYNLYQGTDPALSEAWKAGEVVTINFDKTSRRCWASAGGGAPRPLPAQVSNMQASTPEGETPTIVFTWTNPVDENFAGMILVVKEGSAPNGVTDGTQVYKGTGTTFTYTEGVQFERTYYGRGFAYNSQDKFQMDATGAIASATPSDVPNQVSDLMLTPNKSSATLTWTNPTQQSYSVTKVIQKIDSDPENPNDGTEVYSGTDTTVTVSGLQDSINYHFAVFAISKSGKYKDPVVKTYTPEIWPKYTYTGNSELMKDSEDNWRIKFTSSGKLKWLSKTMKIDIFGVGGGGGGGGADSFYGGNGGGGGSGYTKTVKPVEITNNQEIDIVIGAGGNPSLAGGTTTFGEVLSVNGGQPGGTCSTDTGYTNAIGGNGGSGGGAGTAINANNGKPGSDGSSGVNGQDDYYGTIMSGSGQGTTTREFGEPDGPLHAGGGQGTFFNLRPSYSPPEGSGPNGQSGTNGNVYNPQISAGRGGGGYGGGGGGSYQAVGGAGSAGVVIIRNSRESA